MGSKKSRVEQAIDFVNDHMNEGVTKKDRKRYVTTADETMTPFKMRRRFGICSLDVAIGGGAPAGGPTQIAAPEGVGKNALVWQGIKENQDVYGDDSAVIWLPTEYPIDKPFGHMFGAVCPMSDSEIDIENRARKRDGRSKLSKKQTDKMQRSLGSFLILDEGTTANRFEALVELVKTNVFQIAVVDSIAAILTDQRSDTPLGEFAQQSSEAFLLTEFQKKLWGALGNPHDPDNTHQPNWTTLLLINQVRANRNLQKGGFGRKWVVGGAHALKHGKLLDIILTRGKSIEGTRVIGVDSEGEEKTKRIRLGKEVSWEIAKAKAGTHEGQRGTVEYHYDSGWQVEKDLVNTALYSGVIERIGNSKYVVVDVDGEIADEVTGKQSLYDRAYDDVWFRTVYDLVMRKEGVSCIYRL